MSIVRPLALTRILYLNVWYCYFDGVINKVLFHVEISLNIDKDTRFENNDVSESYKSYVNYSSPNHLSMTFIAA